MQSLSFVPGRALLESSPTTVSWSLRFEDEGVAAYLYVCDRSLGHGDASILDAMLIYNVAVLKDGAAEGTAPKERLAAIEWSRDGMQAVFYLDGTAQAMADFERRISFCRSDFPNFLAEGGERWRASSHAWEQDAVERFEATLYAG